jgi:hypothetical protein
LNHCHLASNALYLLLLGELPVADPLLVLGVGVDFVANVGSKNLINGLLICLSSALRVGPDGSVHLFVELLELHALESLLPFGELLVELLFSLALQHIVVVLDVTTEDVLTMFLGIEGRLSFLGFNGLTTLVGADLGRLDVVTGETLVLVRDVETAIGSTLHGTEDTVTGGGADETDIEESLEGSSVLNVISDVVEGAIDLLVAGESISKAFLCEESSGTEETCAVSGSVVGETSLKTVLFEVLRVGGGHDLVTLKSNVNHLGDYTFVGTAHAESVLACVILILLLVDKALTSIIVGLS